MTTGRRVNSGRAMTLRDQLIRDEGIRYTAYQDTRGVWTLGCGHNLSVPITHDAVMQILRDDILTAETSCLVRPVWHGLSEPRRGVMLNMAFNLGGTGLSRFVEMHDALAAGDYDRAASEMLDSAWGRQVGARATRLAEQMRTSTWC